MQEEGPTTVLQMLSSKELGTISAQPLIHIACSATYFGFGFGESMTQTHPCRVLTRDPIIRGSIFWIFWGGLGSG